MRIEAIQFVLFAEQLQTHFSDVEGSAVAIRWRIARPDARADKWHASSLQRCGCIISARVVTPGCIKHCGLTAARAM